MVNLNVFEFTLFDSLWQGDYCHNTVTTHHVTQKSNPCTAYTQPITQPINLTNFQNGMKIDISYDILMPVDDGSRTKI